MDSHEANGRTAVVFKMEIGNLSTFVRFEVLMAVNMSVVFGMRHCVLTWFPVF